MLVAGARRRQVCRRPDNGHGIDERRYQSDCGAQDQEFPDALGQLHSTQFHLPIPPFGLALDMIAADSTANDLDHLVGD